MLASRHPNYTHHRGSKRPRGRRIRRRRMVGTYQHTGNSPMLFGEALETFISARFKGSLQNVLARLLGKPVTLLSFSAAQLKTCAVASRPPVRQDVPLHAVVGSVGRHRDFNSRFLPKCSCSRERWATIVLEISGPRGLEPVELYQIGRQYFVVDGHHRVSVARWLGHTYIEAYVTEFI
jgi:hypothetical protein